MVKEGMRWRPVSSVGLPHRAREDDTYEGFFIPKDSTIWVAVWYSNLIINADTSGRSIMIPMFTQTPMNIDRNDMRITINSQAPTQEARIMKLEV
jgi:hypothetical protein